MESPLKKIISNFKYTIYEYASQEQKFVERVEVPTHSTTLGTRVVQLYLVRSVDVACPNHKESTHRVYWLLNVVVR